MKPTLKAPDLVDRIYLTYMKDRDLDDGRPRYDQQLLRPQPLPVPDADGCNWTVALGEPLHHPEAMARAIAAVKKDFNLWMPFPGASARAM